MNSQDAVRISAHLDNLQHRKVVRSYWPTRDIAMLIEEVQVARIARLKAEEELARIKALNPKPV